MNEHDKAVMAMMNLTTRIFDNLGAPMRSSAEVCLEDAERCFDRASEDGFDSAEWYGYCVERCKKGMRYIPTNRS